MKRLLFTLLMLAAIPAVACAQSLANAPVAVPTVSLAASPEVALSASPADAAQTPVVNPTIVFFNVPSDYATATGYQVKIYRQSDMAPIGQPQDIGKPAPNAQNKIVGPLNKTGLANMVNYVVKIVNINPLGSRESSTSSGPFIVGALPVDVDGIGVQ
jgi:hypothetical protein